MDYEICFATLEKTVKRLFNNLLDIETKMTYQTYKKNIIIIILSFIVVFLLNLIAINSEGRSIISIGSYFAFRILSLYLLFASIYAYISGVTSTRKLERPLVIIIISFLLVVLSFEPPISTYLALPRRTTVVDRTKLAEIRKDSMSSSIAAERRKDLARTYYLYEGESITYLSTDNKKTIFEPDDRTRRLKESIRKVELGKTNINIIGLTLIVILILSSIGFAVFLLLSSRRRIN